MLVVCLSYTDNVAVQEKQTIHLYSVNGKHLSRELIHSNITDMIISGDHLIFGNMSGVIIIKEINGYVSHVLSMCLVFLVRRQSNFIISRL